MAMETHTTFVTRRAVARLLALAPLAGIPVAAAAAPSLDQEIEALSDQLEAKLRQRWAGAFITRNPAPSATCPYLLTVTTI